MSVPKIRVRFKNYVYAAGRQGRQRKDGSGRPERGCRPGARVPLRKIPAADKPLRGFSHI